MASNQNNERQRRRRMTTEERVRNAVENGIDPSFFRWAMQTYPKDRHPSASPEKQQQQQRPLPPPIIENRDNATADFEKGQFIEESRGSGVSRQVVAYANEEEDDGDEWQQGTNANDLASWKQDALPRFAPEEWMDDNSVSILLREIVKRNPRCGLFDTYQQASVNWNADRPDRLARIRRHMDLFGKDMFVAPLCQANHWVVFVCFLPGGQVYYYDSMFNEAFKVQAWRTMRRWLDLVFDGAVAFSPPITKEVPQQRNGYDCGLHVIRNADLVTRPPNADLPVPPVEPVAIRAYYRMMVEQMTLE